jgi:dTDP-4-amino-4,6-dideoxygalactose transaminase
LTYTIDPLKVESKISSRTKAIIPVHLYGQAAHISQLKKICEANNLFLIEDCAQAHFSKEGNQNVGTFGDVATFSFYPGKNLGAYGDAGAIATNNTELAMKMRMFANHGALKKHMHQIEGINSRLDTIQAAILDVKIKYILKWTSMRIENAAYYSNKLGKIAQITTPFVRPNTEHTFHLYVVRAHKRDQLKSFLESHAIQTAIHYPTILPNLQAYQYLGHGKNDFPVAGQYENEILSLPMYPELGKAQIDHVCECISKFYMN